MRLLPHRTLIASNLISPKLKPQRLQTGQVSNHDFKTWNSGGLLAFVLLQLHDLTYSPNSYREQIDRVSRLKEETIRSIVRNTHDIVLFKEEVSRHLLELRDFAEAE